MESPAKPPVGDVAAGREALGHRVDRADSRDQRAIVRAGIERGRHPGPRSRRPLPVVSTASDVGQAPEPTGKTTGARKPRERSRIDEPAGLGAEEDRECAIACVPDHEVAQAVVVQVGGDHLCRELAGCERADRDETTVPPCVEGDGGAPGVDTGDDDALIGGEEGDIAGVMLVIVDRHGGKELPGRSGVPPAGRG